MLIRNNQLGNPEKFYNDAMMETPTVARSVYDSFASSFATPTVALNALDGEFAKKPEGRAILDSLENINLEKQAPGIGWGQWLADEGASMLGYSLNPITWGFGAAGELAAKSVIGAGSKGLSKVLPDAAGIFMRKPLAEMLGAKVSRYLPGLAGKEGAEQPLSAALLSEKTIETFGQFAGAGVPQGIVDNYNRDTDNIAWGGVAREASEMGAFGLLIGSVPFAYGLVRGKVNRAAGKEPMDILEPSALDAALEKGHITKAQHQWYTDYLEHQKNPDDVAAMQGLKDRASVLAAENGHKVNTVSNESIFQIMTPEDVTNFHGVIADQLASSDLTDDIRQALTHYIVNNSLDRLRSNPEMLDGVRGYLDFINKKLSAKDEQLARANKILDDHLLRGVKDNMPFSQKELFKMMKKSGFESSHIQHLPVTIPANIASHIKQLETINKLKHKLALEKRRFEHKTFYRGESPEYPGQQLQYQMLNFDDEFGKGWWYAESKEHAKHYGETMLELKGAYKIYDVVTGKDAELNHLYERIQRYQKQGYFDNAKHIVGELRKIAQKKGYDALSRREGGADHYGLRTRVNGYARAKTEIMFFERPKSAKKEYEPNKQTVRRIAELEANLPKILTPKEELEHIRKKLLSEKGLPPNFERSPEHQRLIDLSSVWHNAQTLLDRVHLENEYNRQEAFRDVAHQVLEISESQRPALARPDNVVDYLRARIEGNLEKVEPLAELEAKVYEEEKIPTDADAILKEQEVQTSKSSAEEAKKELAASHEKYQEFSKSENIFKNLISCVLGGLGG